MSGILTPAQIRGARGMLDWSMLRLAGEAKVSVSTVKRVESSGGAGVAPPTVAQIRDALEAAGVMFIGDDGLRLGPR